jgi:hypothetical protein
MKIRKTGEVPQTSWNLFYQQPVALVDFLYIHAKNPDYRGCLCSLQGIKIHFREFLYDFVLKHNKLLVDFFA